MELSVELIAYESNTHVLLSSGLSHEQVVVIYCSLCVMALIINVVFQSILLGAAAAGQEAVGCILTGRFI